MELDLSAFEGKVVTKNCVRLKAFILLIDIPFELREHYQHGYGNVLNVRGWLGPVDLANAVQIFCLRYRTIFLASCR